MLAANHEGEKTKIISQENRPFWGQKEEGVDQ